MKLIYSHFGLINDIRNIEVTLTSEYIFKAEINSDKKVLNIELNKNDIKNFYDKKGRINIAGIIGKNAVGKTSTLKTIPKMINLLSAKAKASRSGHSGENACVYTFKENEEDIILVFKDKKIIKIFHNVPSLEIADNNESTFEVYYYSDKKFSKEFSKINILPYIFEVSSNFENLDNISLYGGDISNNGLEKNFKNKINFMVNFNINPQVPLALHPDRIVTYYSHLNGTIIDNKYILYTRLNSEVLNKYIIENTIGIRPFKLEEYAQINIESGSLRYIKIKNLISSFGYNFDENQNDLNDREFVYVVASGIKSLLSEKNITESDKSLITHLVMDYIIITNNRNLQQINTEWIDRFRSINEINEFFDMFFDLIQSDIDNNVDKKVTGTQYNNNVKSEIDVPLDIPNSLKQFKNYVTEVYNFYGLLNLFLTSKKDYKVINIHADSDDNKDRIKGVGKGIANNYLTIKILSKYFKLLNKVIIVDNEIIEYPYSSGELHLIRLISRMYYVASNDIGGRDLLFLLDEPDTSLHPEWQRVFWREMIEMLCKFERNVQILFTSHSPILISDIPKTNLNIFGENNQISDSETFGSNIYDLYKRSFFLEKPMGDFALNKINEFYSFYKKVIKNPSTQCNIKLVKKEINNFEKLTNLVGEPYLKKDMASKILKVKEAYGIATTKRNEFDELVSKLSDEQKLEILKNYSEV